MHSEITCWNFGQVYLVEACWLTVIISLINKAYGPVSKEELGSVTFRPLR